MRTTTSGTWLELVPLVVVRIRLQDSKGVLPKEAEDCHQHGRPNSNHQRVGLEDGLAPTHAGKQGRSDGQLLLHRCAAQPRETHEASVHLEPLGHRRPSVLKPLMQVPHNQQASLNVLRVDSE
jgi:hypothetical protein